MVEVPGPTFIDRSHWGRIRVAGADCLRFLHNQTTNAFEKLSPGQGCDTVFITSKARTLDLASAYVETDDSVLLMVSPGMAPELIAWMDRYIFFADKVTLSNETETTFAITLLGPGTEKHLTSLGLPIPEADPCSHTHGVALGNVPVRVTRGTGVGLPGYTLFGPQAQSKTLHQWFSDQGLVPMTANQWEVLRIRQGRPMPGQELTSDDNPLEAALWHTVSFDKGCYIGQEIIARLNSYKGVKKQLWGFKLDEFVAPGTALTLDGNRVGKLTSVTADDHGVWGLGYLRTKAGGAGLALTAENTAVQAIELPLATRGYLA